MTENKFEKLLEPLSDRLFQVLYKIEIIVLLLVGFKYLLFKTDNPLGII